MSDKRIQICVREQALHLLQGATELRRYRISSAANGTGQRQGSGRTPLGRHHIRLRIGAGCVSGSVFVGRRPTGETWSRELAAKHPQRDWILTRILWLSGDETGFNRGGDCDTLRRYIYIHGTPDNEPMGVPLSHGCIRMRNRDILELFDQVGNGTPVDILASRTSDT